MTSEKYLMEVAEKMGALTEAVNNNTKVFDQFRTEHDKEHRALWKKVDNHTKFIHSFMAIIGFVGFVLGVSWKWIKLKVSGLI